MNKKVNKSVISFGALSGYEMTIQRVTPRVGQSDKVEDVICFLPKIQCSSCGKTVEEPVFFSISEVKRMIGVLEVMTMNESESLGFAQFETV